LGVDGVILKVKLLILQIKVSLIFYASLRSSMTYCRYHHVITITILARPEIDGVYVRS
jgi:hypothetical protein